MLPALLALQAVLHSSALVTATTTCIASRGLRPTACICKTSCTLFHVRFRQLVGCSNTDALRGAAAQYTGCKSSVLSEFTEVFDLVYQPSGANRDHGMTLNWTWRATRKASLLCMANLRSRLTCFLFCSGMSQWVRKGTTPYTNGTKPLRLSTFQTPRVSETQSHAGPCTSTPTASRPPWPSLMCLRPSLCPEPRSAMPAASRSCHAYRYKQHVDTKWVCVRLLLRVPCRAAVPIICPSKPQSSCK